VRGTAEGLNLALLSATIACQCYSPSRALLPLTGKFRALPEGRAVDILVSQEVRMGPALGAAVFTPPDGKPCRFAFPVVQCDSWRGASLLVGGSCYSGRVVPQHKSKEERWSADEGPVWLEEYYSS
jgi:hypothetical protein